MKQKKSTITITFYVVAVLLLLCFAFMTWNVFYSVKMTMDQYSMSFSDVWGQMWQSIVSMFMGQSLPLLVYAFICYGLGYMISFFPESKQSETKEAKVETVAKVIDTKAVAVDAENTVNVNEEIKSEETVETVSDSDGEKAEEPKPSTEEAVNVDNAEMIELQPVEVAVVEEPKAEETKEEEPKAEDKEETIAAPESDTAINAEANEPVEVVQEEVKEAVAEEKAEAKKEAKKKPATKKNSANKGSKKTNNKAKASKTDNKSKGKDEAKA